MTPTTEALIKEIKDYLLDNSGQCELTTMTTKLLTQSAERLKELEAKFEAARMVAISISDHEYTGEIIEEKIAARIKEKKK